jgi:uroporphyrinogen decarboxylase
MTPRQRLITVLRGDLPDCVPVAPDFSNMIPARLTGKPFWDLYLYNDPPIYQAYIDCAKHFNIDALMDGYYWLPNPWDISDPDESETFIVFRDEMNIVTQRRTRGAWEPTVNRYHRDNPPYYGITPARIGLPATPERWEPIEGRKPLDNSPAGLTAAKQRMGDQGLVGITLTGTLALASTEDVYRYHDNPADFEPLVGQRIEAVERRFEWLMSLDDKPDFFCVGGSGTFIWQTEAIFRHLALPTVKRAIDLASAAGMPTHIHSCGPEARLVEIMATETNLTVIDPLEIPPMGDCDLADLKKRFGDRIVLKGNLHTTDVMLRGSVDDVIAASKRAIDDGAEGGRFILSTGDQCGRDTPDENLHAMIDTARTYGRYDATTGRCVGDAR